MRGSAVDTVRLVGNSGATYIVIEVAGEQKLWELTEAQLRSLKADCDQKLSWREQRP